MSALADITGPATVIDGDTIKFHGEHIRLHGIDAPESAQTCLADGTRCADNAARLRELVGEGAWSSSSEMIGDIGLAILGIRDSATDRMSDEAARTLDRCMDMVRRVWPEIGSGRGGSE